MLFTEKSLFAKRTPSNALLPTIAYIYLFRYAVMMTIGGILIRCTANHFEIQKSDSNREEDIDLTVGQSTEIVCKPPDANFSIKDMGFMYKYFDLSNSRFEQVCSLFLL